MPDCPGETVTTLEEEPLPALLFRDHVPPSTQALICIFADEGSGGGTVTVTSTESEA